MEDVQAYDESILKRGNPFHTNIISKTFFCWLIPFLVKGFKQQITEDDMFGVLKTHEAVMLGDKLEKAWNDELARKKSPSLWMVLIRVFKFEITLYGLAFLFREILVGFSQPLLIRLFLKYYEPGQTNVTKNQACLYGGLLVLMSLIQAVCNHHCLMGVLHMGMKMKIGMSSLIYRKALKLNMDALAQTTVGQMVNLLSNDVERFNQATMYVHYLWLAPVETLFLCFGMYYFVGYYGTLGTIFILMFTPLHIYLGTRISKYRLNTAILTDERVRLMSEILHGIQVIKMYNWETPFAKLVAISRKKEMKQINMIYLVAATVLSLNQIIGRLAIFVCLASYALTHNTLNATFAFTVHSFYNILREAVSRIFPRAATQFAEAAVSVKRIREFLLYTEVEPVKSDRLEYDRGVSLVLPADKRKVGVHLKNVSTKWVNSPHNTLTNISCDFYANQLVAVVGPVGTGKSTLLYVVLKELTPLEGSVAVDGLLSYSSQEPWLFGGTVRQNILFGQTFIPEKYEEVVRVCALERDFKLLPYGDRTPVSDRGVTLSGGQRARINLARAVYKEADIYLLDDPLSAVDPHVGKHIFEKCILGYLKNKGVVLVTHQLQYLSQVEMIYLIQDGKIGASGTYSDLQKSDNEFAKLFIKKGDEEKEKGGKSQTEEHKEEEEDTRVAPTLKRESRSEGVVKKRVYACYFKAGGGFWLTLIAFLLFVLSQMGATITDYYISAMVNLEQFKTINKVALYNGTAEEHANLRKNNRLNYFVYQFLTMRRSIMIYSIMLTSTAVVLFIRAIYFFRYCIRASTNLHNRMFDKVVYASMLFFNTNPPGRILNRFSKDIGAIDELLPISYFDTLEIFLSVMAIALLVGSMNLWILPPTGGLTLLFCLMRLAFLRTSRDIKRVEAVTRSPIYTHLSASLQGLTTIRAFEAQEILKREFDNYQNINTSAFFLFLTANRTFGFWLDFNCIVYIALVIISVLFIETGVLAGKAGLALTQSITLTGRFQWGMRQWSELEHNMTSVERVEEYIQIQPERDFEIVAPPKTWPQYGRIKFNGVCLKYFERDPYVLEDLDFEILPTEKVGVVGRTGAGKSSLINAIFRLADIQGTILIDNISTKEVTLATLRSKISIIPQVPVLFSGTLRKNLDPFDEYHDRELWDALAEVELKDVVSGELDSPISEGGSNFSVGQRQLLCLARTIVRNNKILILDEATANVDAYTDKLIQSTIRKKFANCTVLTIAHRLHTIMDSDRVLVMDAGKVIEYDHPYKLLQDPNGVFYELALQTGKSMVDKFMEIAKANYRPS